MPLDEIQPGTKVRELRAMYHDAMEKFASLETLANSLEDALDEERSRNSNAMETTELEDLRWKADLGNRLQSNLRKIGPLVVKQIDVELPDGTKLSLEKGTVKMILDFILNSFGLSNDPTVADSYDVILTDVGGKKIQCIKVVRQYTGLGLRDAKGIVDSVMDTNQGFAIRQGITREEAEKTIKTFTEVGSSTRVVATGCGTPEVYRDNVTVEAVPF